MASFELGSRTAKGGFANEEKIKDKFNDWKRDKEAQDWLKTMGYKISEINKVLAINLSNKHKADVQVQIFLVMKSNEIKLENISIKRSENKSGYNQIDRTKVDNYKEKWNIPNEVTELLKLFTGETKPKLNNTRDKRRTFLTEMTKTEQNKIITFFSENKVMVVNDLFRGREGIIPDWFMVTYHNKSNNTTTYILERINKIMNLYSKGKIYVTPQGSLRIGEITMQRKGGTPDPESLQFKIDPMYVFKFSKHTF